MTDQTPDTGPVLGRNVAPEHGPDFWNTVEAAISGTPRAAHRNAQELERTQELRPHVDPSVTTQLERPIGERTEELIAVRPTSATPLGERRSFRRLMPLAAAAAVLAMIGLGFIVNQGRGADNTSEVVAGQLVPEQGAAAASAANSTGDSEQEETIPQKVTEVEPAQSAADRALVPPVEQDDQPFAEPNTTAAAAPIPDFDNAAGVEGDPEYLPLDQGLPEHAKFLGNWSDRKLSWYTVADPQGSCDDANYSEIRYVNGSGFTLAARDPQLGFSGDVSHLTVGPADDVAAWLVSCGTQMELFVAPLDSSGALGAPTLAWFGQGSLAPALVLWDGSEVSVNTVEPGGSAFSASYNLDTKIVSRNGGPSRIMIEATAPAARSLTPIAASPDAALTYWTGDAPVGVASECPELFGTNRADSLWLRQGEGQWQVAAADLPLGQVTAAALEPELAQLAFADRCDQQRRVLIGVQQSDGRIAGVRPLDLAPFAPGFVSQLDWVDPFTLRIEIDNQELGFGSVRFELRLGDEPDDLTMVQLDS